MTHYNVQYRVGELFAIFASFAHGIVGVSVMVFGALELLVMREGALMTIVVEHSAMLLEYSRFWQFLQNFSGTSAIGRMTLPTWPGRW